jgi:surface polysaccharide O-acyltransferase-like enzyme
MFYIDNIRWLMIIFVIVVHSDVIYGPIGQFFGFEDRAEELGVSEILLAIIGILLQSFFMGLLFLLAGYFVPNSLARKGQRRFILDRAKRLGIPSLIFILALAPLIVYPIHFSSDMSFPEYAVEYYPNPLEWDTGPMWFTIALLIFSAAWTLKPSEWTLDRFRGPLSRRRVGVLMAVAVVGTFLVRIPFPMGTDVWNMQLCFFTQYVLLFIVGIIAYHNDWFATLTTKDGRFYMLVAVATVVFVFFPILIAGGALEENIDPYNGGLYWQAFGYALFEQVFGISVCLYMLVRWRERHNRQGWLARKLSDNGFAVYMFHAPVVIGIAVVLKDFDLPGIVKFLVLAPSAIIVTYALAELVLRRIPGLKRVL